jgi:hypothetical protein
VRKPVGWYHNRCPIGFDEATEVVDDELRNGYESGFADPTQTIYYDGRVVNQFEGVLAVDIAVRVAATLGVDMTRIAGHHLSREGIVRAIREQVEEG